MATPIDKHSFVADLALRGLAYGFDTLIVDGMDPVSLYLALQEVTKMIRETHFPFLVEAKTYRFYHHTGRSRGSVYGYRSKKEEDEWFAKDPVLTFPERLLRSGILTEGDCDRIRTSMRRVVERAVHQYVESRNGKLNLV